MLPLIDFEPQLASFKICAGDLLSDVFRTDSHLLCDLDRIFLQTQRAVQHQGYELHVPAAPAHRAFVSFMHSPLNGFRFSVKSTGNFFRKFYVTRALHFVGCDISSQGATLSRAAIVRAPMKNDLKKLLIILRPLSNKSIFVWVLRVTVHAHVFPVAKINATLNRNHFYAGVVELVFVETKVRTFGAWWKDGYGHAQVITSKRRAGVRVFLPLCGCKVVEIDRAVTCDDKPFEIYLPEHGVLDTHDVVRVDRENLIRRVQKRVNLWPW